MKIRLFTAVVLSVAFGMAVAQDASQPVPSSTSGAQTTSPMRGNGQEPRGGRGGWGGGMGMGMAGGRGLMGTVSEAAADHYSIRTDAGEMYTIHFSANTRVLKQIGGQGQGGPRMGPGATPPEPIKPSEIKVGDVISAMGEMDAGAKSLGAMVVVLMDPERAKQMREMQANFGKTWLMGKVTAISDFTVTLQSSVDNANHKFVADENTSFRKHRDPVTLADIQVGDSVRVEGAIKNGAFVAASVAVMGGGPGGPRGDAPSPASK